MNEIPLGYAAGFIDADGCITCSENTSGNPCWQLIVVQADSNDPGGDLMLRFQERWGGNVCKVGKKQPHHSDQWKWKVQGVEAAIAIHDLFGYLVVKKEKAVSALEHFASDPKIARIMWRVTRQGEDTNIGSVSVHSDVTNRMFDNRRTK